MFAGCGLLTQAFHNARGGLEYSGNNKGVSNTGEGMVIQPDRIAFDVDGVVADTFRVFVDTARREFGCDFAYEDITEYDFRTVIDIDETVAQSIVQRILDDPSAAAFDRFRGHGGPDPPGGEARFSSSRHGRTERRFGNGSCIISEACPKTACGWRPPERVKKSIRSCWTVEHLLCGGLPGDGFLLEPHRSHPSSSTSPGTASPTPSCGSGLGPDRRHDLSLNRKAALHPY